MTVFPNWVFVSGRILILKFSFLSRLVRQGGKLGAAFVFELECLSEQRKLTAEMQTGALVSNLSDAVSTTSYFNLYFFYCPAYL